MSLLEPEAQFFFVGSMSKSDTPKSDKKSDKKKRKRESQKEEESIQSPPHKKHKKQSSSHEKKKETPPKDSKKKRPRDQTPTDATPSHKRKRTDSPQPIQTQALFGKELKFVIPSEKAEIHIGIWSVANLIL